MPTRQVIAGFAPITTDNRRVLVQEWLAVLTAFTGARTPVMWFKVCPGLLATTAGLLVLAGLL